MPDDQPLVGFMSNDEWDALLGELNGLVQRMEALPDGETKEQVFHLLDGIDALHRESLRRLVRLFKDGVLEAVVSDPAIHTLMELYDLLPASVAPPAPGTAPKSRFPTIPIRAVPATPPQRYPHWLPVLAHTNELPAGTTREVAGDDGPILLARHGDDVFALDSRCARDGSPLAGAVLGGYTLTCPHHAGCHYDIRQGTQLGSDAKVACHPVQVDASGRVLVGLDMDFTPNLPSL